MKILQFYVIALEKKTKEEKLKNIKVAAEIMDLTHIQKNSGKGKLCGGKILSNMKLEKIYNIDPKFLSIAKESQWKRLVGIKI